MNVIEKSACVVFLVAGGFCGGRVYERQSIDSLKCWISRYQDHVVIKKRIEGVLPVLWEGDLHSGEGREMTITP